MPKYPEIIQTRAPAGTVARLDEVARANGQRPGDVVRDAVIAHLAALASDGARVA